MDAIDPRMARGRLSLSVVAIGVVACSSGSPGTPVEAGVADGGSDARRALDAADAAPDAAIEAGPDAAADAGYTLAPWNTEAHILVDGVAAAAAQQIDCRTQVCQHDEDTDMIAWNGAVYLVHRTARSQVLGPNSGLLVYRSTDQGLTFQQTARIDAPMTPIDSADDATAGRDIRDPAFFVVTDAQGHQQLHLKAITRLPTDLSKPQARDTGVDSISVGMASADGVTWSPLARLAPTTWSFWRPREVGGTFYSAAYHDGDSSVSLFSSADGVTWVQGAQVYGVTANTPLETELVPMPDGMLLALVRTDGSDADLQGNDGNQKTAVCWAVPPFAAWTCPQTIQGERFDGPLAFFWQQRLFVIARRHLDTDGVRNRKRTALFELTPQQAVTDGGVDGAVEAGAADAGTWGGIVPLGVTWWGDLPSAGDTAYAGVAMADATHARVVWYAGDVPTDADWFISMLSPTNIWVGTIDLSLVH
jgi:hypothetical protein